MLSAAKVALIGVIVAIVALVEAPLSRRSIARLANWSIVVVGLSARVLGRTVASRGTSTCPSCTTVWSHTPAAATACGDASECKEDEEGGKDDDGDDNPSAPAIPSRIPPIAIIPVVKVR